MSNSIIHKISDKLKNVNYMNNKSHEMLQHTSSRAYLLLSQFLWLMFSGSCCLISYKTNLNFKIRTLGWKLTSNCDTSRVWWQIKENREFVSRKKIGPNHLQFNNVSHDFFALLILWVSIIFSLNVNLYYWRTWIHTYILASCVCVHVCLFISIEKIFSFS